MAKQSYYTPDDQRGPTNPGTTHGKHTMSDFDQVLSQIARLAPLIKQEADAAEANRHVSASVARSMAAEGLYRVAVPRNVGGSERHPVEQIRTIEAVSQLDGATGWALMIGIEGMGILGAALPLAEAQVLFKDPKLILAAALNPLGKAVETEGGYRISGQWPFASGCHNADYFWSQSILRTAAGEVIADDAGPILLESVVARDNFEILDTWHVSGLRGSGSHDIRIDDVFVPEVATTRIHRRDLCAKGTLYQLPSFCRLAYNKVGVATGIARAAIDHFCNLATQKTPRGTRNKLREREDAQLAVAEAELAVGRARSFVFETVNDVWDTVDRGDEPAPRQRALLQLACSGACDASVDAVQKVVGAAGASANFTTNPLERCMRDVMVVRQHFMVSPQWYHGAGRVLLGLPSEALVL